MDQPQQNSARNEQQNRDVTHWWLFWLLVGLGLLFVLVIIILRGLCTDIWYIRLLGLNSVFCQDSGIHGNQPKTMPMLSLDGNQLSISGGNSITLPVSAVPGAQGIDGTNGSKGVTGLQGTVGVSGTVGTAQNGAVLFGNTIELGTNPLIHNTVIPQAGYDFTMDATGGGGNLIATGTHGAGTPLSVSGAGTRMVWAPQKAALRAGTVSGTQWDNVNVGDYSIAVGQDTIASGIGSFAGGATSTASGDGSLAIGSLVSASGPGSVALGYSTIASGYLSTAFGSQTQATGGFATAFGSGSVASGSSATAFGQNTTASLDNTTAFGYNTTASNTLATAFGGNTVASGGSSTAFGSLTTASGNFATAFGQGSIASGDYSTAFGHMADGIGPQAIGSGSTAFGTATIANGIDSTAFGYSTVADGQRSIAFGTTTNAGGYGSTAFGISSIASGDYGIAFGDTSTASGLNSTAFGFHTIASNTQSTTFGAATLASGLNSTAFGDLAVASGNVSTAFGFAAHATGVYSTAFGFHSTASLDYSTAFGRDTVASGISSTAFGRMTTASGTNSTAFGSNEISPGVTCDSFGYSFTTASGPSSTAFGACTMASGDRATAFGSKTLASNVASTAFGQFTTASGASSVAFGESTTASGDNSTALGQHITVSGSGSVGVNLSNTGPYTLVQNNTFAVMGGTVGLGTVTPSHQLDVSDTTTTNVSQFLGSAGTQCTVVTGTGWSCSSDERLKTNILSINDGLDKIMQLNGVTYNWKADSTGTQQDGFIAQEVQKVLPELVTTDPNTGYLSLNKDGIMAYLVNAVQQQQTQIDTLKAGQTPAGGTSVDVFKTLADAKAVRLSGDLTVGGSVVINGRLETSSANSGTAVIPAGQTTVHVVYPQTFSSIPHASITPKGIVKTYFGVINETKTGFDIVLSDPLTTDAQFNWQAL